ncbi:MAG TPA: helicase-related protein, partial [Byssovorax sp.]
MTDASQITALLGPTNTGKTHRAIERMLEHESGVIGLPLRLLAREVYDRVTARVGEQRVALVTGEEKRVPRRPDYWICTVEAMPEDLDVDFVAVDEVQLAANPQRGHVFTDRLLRARGRRETFFLGADTMRRVIAELVPTARVEARPRLSTLSPAAACKLARLPPRSAVVAFSMAQVVEIAERLRALRGGAAVVLGALSPRTRNAQVALFQAGEVDFLVATDAIGMGLNLAVKHVAFAGLRKFDGRVERALDVAEIAQIAGRAGRHLEDGTFGAVLPLALPPDVEADVAAHRFEPVKQIYYRSHDLDFASVDALVASLGAPPRRRGLRAAPEAEDLAALARLATDADVRARAKGAEAVALLWDVARVPDFRKLLFESHVALLAELFAQLSGPRSEVDAAYLDERVREIDDTTGDVDALIDRIAAIRTWTYVASHDRWVRDAFAWQERTRAVEDRLSDALHERLVQRFVDRRGGRVSASKKGARPSSPRGSDAEIARAPVHHPFAKLAAWTGARAEAGVARADEREDAWIERLVAAPHAALAVDARGEITFTDAGAEPRRVGRLARGGSLLLPEVTVVGLDDAPGARARVARRLLAWSRDLVGELVAPAHAARAS